MRLLQSGDIGVHVSNDVVNVAVIDRDVTELAVNMGNMNSRKMMDVNVTSACSSYFIHD